MASGFAGYFSGILPFKLATARGQNTLFRIGSSEALAKAGGFSPASAAFDAYDLSRRTMSARVASLLLLHSEPCAPEQRILRKRLIRSRGKSKPPPFKNGQAGARGEIAVAFRKPKG